MKITESELATQLSKPSLSLDIFIHGCRKDKHSLPHYTNADSCTIIDES